MLRFSRPPQPRRPRVLGQSPPSPASVLQRSSSKNRHTAARSHGLLSRCKRRDILPTMAGPGPAWVCHNNMAVRGLGRSQPRQFSMDSLNIFCEHRGFGNKPAATADNRKHMCSKTSSSTEASNHVLSFPWGGLVGYGVQLHSDNGR